MTHPLRDTLLFILLLGVGCPVRAQLEGGPVVPRGTILLQFTPSLQVVDGLYAKGTGEKTPLGSQFFIGELGSVQTPTLAAAETRFRELAGGGGAPSLRLGKTTGRLSLEETVVRWGASYGLSDRVAAGVTVPFIKRRMDTILRYSPDGTNVGLSPGIWAGTVSDFLAQASSALVHTRGAVDRFCTSSGEGNATCQSGRNLIAEAEGFLALLGTSYRDDRAFPLSGTDLGAAITGRWSILASGLGAWNAHPPANLPLATTPVTDAFFRESVVIPAWPIAGLPLTTPEPLWDLGDIELHAAARLMDREASDVGARAGSPSSLSFRSDVVGTLRFPTGAADSLRTLAPSTSVRGVWGVDIRIEAEALLREHLSIGGFVEGGWNGDRELDLLSPDPSQPFTPGQTRARVRWSPGGHLRMGILPRLRLGPALSLGAGWHLFHQEADTFAATVPTGLIPSSPAGSRTAQSIALELRYVARTSPVVELAPFPFETFFRLSQSIAGSGSAAPVERQVEGGVSLLLGR
ncbi:MAG: hypothetical protein EXR92_05660 [Gemmatimonadetes bacterium]|nr:hypothetical protein [Gemmatimonadota bacterium]